MRSAAHLGDTQFLSRVGVEPGGGQESNSTEMEESMWPDVFVGGGKECGVQRERERKE